MTADRFLFVAREGWPFVLATAVAALLVHQFYGAGWAAPLWVATVFFAFLFRDPERFMAGGALAVLSPADGVVTVVEKTRDPYLDRDAVIVGIALSRLGSYATRSPVEGKVMQRWSEPVTRRGAMMEAHGIWLQTDEGDNVVLAIDPAGRLMRARCDVQPGERTGQGHRCGFVPFGGRIEVILPPNARVDVRLGQRVRAGMDALARLVYK